MLSIRIGEPARKHRVVDEDIWHAVRLALRAIQIEDDMTMLIGPARDGTLLEVGVLEIDGPDPVVLHAMPMRPRFARWLTAGQR